MYNRYDGNTGRYVRMPEPERPEPSALRRPPPAQRPREEPRRTRQGRLPQGETALMRRADAPLSPRGNPAACCLAGLRTP